MSYLSKIAIYSSILFLSACSSFLPATGPSYQEISHEAESGGTDIAREFRLVDVDEQEIMRLPEAHYNSFNAGTPSSWRSGKPALPLGEGDGIQVSIFEAPPAVLLGSAIATGTSDLSIGYGSGSLNLPEQMVGLRGTIMVPFAGEVSVSGKTASQVERIIRTRLSKIANQPQVVVRLTQNQSNNVVVLSDGRSQRMPLTSKGERLLDAIPLVGDAKKVKNVSVRLTRKGETRAISLSRLSQDSSANVYLRTGDVVAVVQDPYRVTMLGATNVNTVVDFGDDGLTVAEALGRVAGLNDFRADPRGIFVFRRSDTMYDAVTLGNNQTDVRHRIPTIFRIDVRDARGMMLAQSFKLQDKDMVYVSNAPSVQLQKVLNLFNSTLTPVVNTANAVNAVN